MSHLLLHNLAPMLPWHPHNHITIPSPYRLDLRSIQFKLKFSVCKEGNDSEETKGARLGPKVIGRKGAVAGGRRCLTALGNSECTIFGDS